MSQERCTQRDYEISESFSNCYNFDLPPFSLQMWCRFQQLGGDPGWAARGGRRKGKGRSDSSSSDSEANEDGILQRTGQYCVLYP